jgi:transposase
VAEESLGVEPEESLASAGTFLQKIPRSSRHLRNEADFEFFLQEMKTLQQWEDAGEVDLYYFDEMGVNLSAVVPYGWQKKGKSEAFMPATQGQNLTTLAFMSRCNQFSAFTCPGAATAELVTASFEEFAASIQRKTVVIPDNASTHRSRLFRTRRREWEKKGLLIQFIAPYYPGLNLIEILWKNIKYHWLEPRHFLSATTLREAPENILQNFGSKYRITFT